MQTTSHRHGSATYAANSSTIGLNIAARRNHYGLLDPFDSRQHGVVRL
jgi:hypothetical protein